MRENVKDVSDTIEKFVENLNLHNKKIKQNNEIKKVKYSGLKKLIELNNLVKEYKIKKQKISVVNNLSFNIYQGQNVALLGGNGAGKTTTVEMIVGILKPTSGKITYNFSDSSTATNGSSKIGIQFQDSSYPQGLTVKDVIKSVNKIYGNLTNDREMELLTKIFGIDEFINNKASSLSGGQHQRLNALLAIVNKPELLILDELSTGLDIKIKSRLVNFLKEFIKKTNSTLLLVSHDINEIETLADRIVIIDKGVLIYDNTIEETRKKYGNVSKCLEHFI
ncbi:ABC transporter ATP-binding protein [Mycoplasma sp. Mirounga ES2805-ORL]|uniref:ABC transporter ATP-binding protein n=1 Tax=Mycoplasma sp. Mirounga ES2805-ORL TaxID=754514 RepID=UPI00197B49AD|nr:ABC transporter ATP-binding protein [Mycoplasma sp. Mirounga ES2805-ORL]QSF13494.1 ABC transporter ATP-binding protein [Mycoplasma sp. Mirounga ES2805-ORL]